MLTHHSKLAAGSSQLLKYLRMKCILHIILCFMSLKASAQLLPISSGVYHWKDLPVKKGTNRESRSIVEGTSAHFDYLEIHTTTQLQGAKPSPAHANKDIEELIIVKEGTMKVTIGSQTTLLGKGGVILILPAEMQTFENVGNDQLTYYVMRYRSRKPMDIERGRMSGGSLLLNMDSLDVNTNEKGSRRNYFERATAMCENFELHLTQRNVKGPSHEPHTHVDTEIILVLEGNPQVVMDNKEYNGAPGDLFFINSGLVHAGGNGSEAPCLYFAFKWR